MSTAHPPGQPLDADHRAGTRADPGADNRAATDRSPVAGSTRRPRWWWFPARLVGFLAGVTTAAVGAGLVFAHLGEPGAAVATGLGFALLATGGGLAVWTAGSLLRGTRRRWWLLVVPVLLVATYVALWTVGQAVAATFPGRPALGSRTPADVGLAYRDVTFPAGDGVRLAGWYVPSGNGAAVVLLHGAGSTRTAVLDHAAVLAAGGYGVLMVDARGHGQSAGRSMDFGWYGELDCAGAVDFLASQPDVGTSRIGLVGLSMGGEEAIGAAGADERVAAVVAEGATNRVSEDKGYLTVYGFRGQIQRGIDWLTYAATEVLSSAPRPGPLHDSVATAGRRADPASFLLITGGNVATEGYAADYLRGRAPSAVRVWTVPGAGHTAGLRVAPDEWSARVVGFLEESLR